MWRKGAIEIGIKIKDELLEEEFEEEFSYLGSKISEAGRCTREI